MAEEKWRYPLLVEAFWNWLSAKCQDRNFVSSQFLDFHTTPDHWPAVLQAIAKTPDVNKQVNSSMGDGRGGSHFLMAEALGIAMHPSALQLLRYQNDLPGLFRALYSPMEAFFASDTMTFEYLTPLRGFRMDDAELSLSAELSISKMSVDEGLEFGLVPPPVSGLPPTYELPQGRQFAIRRRETLDKIYGDANQLAERNQEVSKARRKSDALSNHDRASVLSALGVIDDSMVSAPAPEGRLLGPFWKNSGYGRWNAAQSRHENEVLYLRRNDYDRFLLSFSKLSDPQFLIKNRRLGVAVRRLGNLARRDDQDDAFVDVMIAAEAIYFAGGTSEITYRLSLNAAVFVDLETMPGLSRLQIRKLMADAYALRSSIVHGDLPSKDKLRIGDKECDFAAFQTAVKKIVRGAVEKMLRSSNSTATIEIDWNKLLLESKAASP